MIWLILTLLLADNSEGRAFTLETVIQKALERNVQHQAIIEKRTEVQGGVKEARSAVYPQVTMKGSYSEVRSPSLLNSKDFEDLIEQFPNGAFEPQVQPLHSWTVEVNQALFTWGRVKSAIELAAIVGTQTEHQIQVSALDVAHRAASIYFLCQTTEAALSVEVEGKDVLQRAYDLAKIKLELGAATELERLRAEAALAEVEPLILQRTSDALLAKRSLMQLLNMPDQEAIILSPVSMGFSEPSASDLLIQKGLNSRPDLKEINSRQSSLEKQRDIQNSIGLPNLEFNGFFGREVLYTSNLGDPQYNSWRASLDFSWNLFDGFRKKGQVAQINSQIRQVSLQESDLRNQIRYEIEQAVLQYSTALKKMDVSKLHVEVARKAVQVAEASYQEGVALQTDWLDAQQDARRARLNLILAELNAMQSRIDLNRSIGEMPTAKPMATPAATPSVGSSSGE